MTSRKKDIAWEPIAQWIGQSQAGLTQTFPPSLRRLSILEALQAKTVACTPAAAQQAVDLAQRLAGLLEQLRVFDSISRCPIVAVTGLLNAGKSSLLATYLSPANRPRVLRGVGNHSGTHRFVVWLPKIWWDDPNLLNTLIAFMTNLFGHPPERLADDPAQAAEQYNGRVVMQEVMLEAGTTHTGSAVPQPDPMSIPLIAYDEHLNKLKLGLIDCPDIQTGFVAVGERALTPSAVAALRQSHLARIGRLCSAFLVVSKLNSLHDEGLLQILTTLRDAMPGVPRMLAINKIKARYAPSTVLDEARGLVERFGLEAVFGAYDYRSSLANSRVPPPPPNMALSDEPQPIFVELGSSADAPAPRRYLFNLGDRLDAGELSQASSRSLTMQLLTLTSRAVEWLETNQQQRQQQIRDAWQTLAHACYEFMAEHDIHGRATGLRLQASPAIIVQMADSLQRTAPTWMRISLSIDRTARQFQQAISNSAARFTILKNASESVTQFTKKFRRGEGAQVMTPERLAKSIQQSDRHASLESVTSEKLVSDCGYAMQRFAEENQTLLDEQELNRWSEQVWKEMSWRDKLWKGTQPLAVVMAPLLAVVLVPFDGGGTAVLVFASAKELLAAAGLAALLGPAATGGEALSIIHRETPWRQLSDLFAICCDAVGLPRPQTAAEMPHVQCSGQSRSLLLSQMETKLGPAPPAVTEWQLPEQTLHTLRGLARG
jgi:hypothetical protein